MPHILDERNKLNKEILSQKDNLTTIKLGDKIIHLIGTAHVSAESVTEVNRIIDETNPDQIAVELCDKRYETIKDANRWKSTDLFQVFKSGKAALLFTNLMVGSFQARIGKQLGVKPGAEMIAAIDKASQINANLQLIDRDVQVTMKRTWRKLGFWKKMQLFSAILGGVIFNEEIKKEDIENLKQSDMLTQAMQSFGEEIPGLKNTLIDERDIYMASHLTEMPGKVIVAVVGAGHLPGITKHIGETLSRDEISIVPPPSKIFGFIKWLIPAIIIGMIVYGFTLDVKTGTDALLVWFLVNGILSTLGVLIGGGKIISALIAFVGAPITSLNPLIGIGMFVGVSEAYFRKPKVEDFESVYTAFEKLPKSIYKNSITRILLVALLSGLGNQLGTIVGAAWVAEIIRNGIS